MRRAEEAGVKYVDIAKTPLNPDFLRILDLEKAQEAEVLPFYSMGKKVELAVADLNAPKTIETVEALKKAGYEINLYLSSGIGLSEAYKIYGSTQQYKKPELIERVEQSSIKTYEKEIASMKEIEARIGGVTAEEALNMVNVGAIKAGASDAHFEPEKNGVFVRFRIDGMLHKVMVIKPEVYANILSQIKYKSRMRLNVSNVPQDGRYEFRFNDRDIDVRVSSIPTPYGESFVCRFLDQKPNSMNFEELGFEGHSLRKLTNAAKISHGMILTTGPTGSGKTTTLYTLINSMKKPENKIITLEDPVEYYIEGVTQSQIEEKHGYSFASGLRSVLRHDPNIVMIGEIRDLDTAQTAAQAALTGHVVLSTLHTNSAIESIPRLINMGLPPFMVAPALDTIIAQRLVRKVCPNCVTMRDISASEKVQFETLINNLKAVNPTLEANVPNKIPEIKGCDKCSQTGYSGRMVVCEAVTVTEEMKRLILAGSSTINLIAAARKEGMITMREDGFLKVAKGLTTLDEVYRATNVID